MEDGQRGTEASFVLNEMTVSSFLCSSVRHRESQRKK